VRLAQTLLDRIVRVCGTMKANRDTPCDLEQEGKHLKNGQSAFQRKGDVVVQVWKNKRLVRMISTMHDATIVNTGQKDRKTNMEIKKPGPGYQKSRIEVSQVLMTLNCQRSKQH